MSLLYRKDNPPKLLELLAMGVFMVGRRRKAIKPEAWALYQCDGYTKFVDLMDKPKPPVGKARGFYWTEMKRKDMK